MFCIYLFYFISLFALVFLYFCILCTFEFVETVDNISVGFSFKYFLVNILVALLNSCIEIFFLNRFIISQILFYTIDDSKILLATPTYFVDLIFNYTTNDVVCHSCWLPELCRFDRNEHRLNHVKFALLIERYMFDWRHQFWNNLF